MRKLIKGLAAAAYTLAILAAITTACSDDPAKGGPSTTTDWTQSEPDLSNNDTQTYVAVMTEITDDFVALLMEGNTTLSSAGYMGDTGAAAELASQSTRMYAIQQRAMNLDAPDGFWDVHALTVAGFGECAQGLSIGADAVRYGSSATMYEAIEHVRTCTSNIEDATDRLATIRDAALNN